MKNKKYELIPDDTIVVANKVLYRIRALKDLETITGKIVKVGTLGGYVETEDNLSHLGCAWVGGNACVGGDAYVGDNARVGGGAYVGDNARVGGDAYVRGNASIKSDQDILVVDKIGSHNDTTTFYRTADGGISVTCGCFTGTIDEFAAAVKKTHGDNKYGREYRAAIELAKIHIEMDGDKKQWGTKQQG